MNFLFKIQDLFLIDRKLKITDDNGIQNWDPAPWRRLFKSYKYNWKKIIFKKQ